MLSKDYRLLVSHNIVPLKPTLRAIETKNSPLTFYLNLLLRMKSLTYKKASLNHQLALLLKPSPAYRLNNNQRNSSQLKLSQMPTLITIQTTTMAALTKIHPVMQVLEVVVTKRVLPSNEISKNTMRFVRTKKHPSAAHLNAFRPKGHKMVSDRVFRVFYSNM